MGKRYETCLSRALDIFADAVEGLDVPIFFQYTPDFDWNDKIPPGPRSRELGSGRSIINRYAEGALCLCHKDRRQGAEKLTASVILAKCGRQ